MAANENSAGGKNSDDFVEESHVFFDVAADGGERLGEQEVAHVDDFGFGKVDHDILFGMASGVRNKADVFTVKGQDVVCVERFTGFSFKGSGSFFKDTLLDQLVEVSAVYYFDVFTGDKVGLSMVAVVVGIDNIPKISELSAAQFYQGSFKGFGGTAQAGIYSQETVLAGKKHDVGFYAVIAGDAVNVAGDFYYRGIREGV